MNHKEEKFWDALRTYMYGVTAAGPYVEKALTGKGDTGDALASLRQLKRECRNQKEVVMSRMYKAYSKPITLDAAKGFIDRAYTIIDQLTSLLDLLDTIQLGGKPEEVEPLSSLVACSLLEIQYPFFLAILIWKESGSHGSSLLEGYFISPGKGAR